MRQLSLSFCLSLVTKQIPQHYKSKKNNNNMAGNLTSAFVATTRKVLSDTAALAEALRDFAFPILPIVPFFFMPIDRSQNKRDSSFLLPPSLLRLEMVLSRAKYSKKEFFAVLIFFCTV